MKAMKFPRIDFSGLSRDLRVGILAAVLAVIGLVIFGRGWHATGSLVILVALALVATFYLLVVRPARIPKDAVLTIRIADGMREDALDRPWSNCAAAASRPCIICGARLKRPRPIQS
jgi:hypothetical protein